MNKLHIHIETCSSDSRYVNLFILNVLIVTTLFQGEMLNIGERLKFSWCQINVTDVSTSKNINIF